jgi:hypothetical protein
MARKHPASSAARACALALIVALPAAAAIGCSANLKNKSYRTTVVAAVPGAPAARTNDRIDKYATYASFFRLGKNVDSITISVTAENVADILGTKKTRKAYFIVEKVIDMTRLKNPNLKHLHAELGRNYNNDWNREMEITLVSTGDEPFKTLDAGSLYRVRYTTFADENFTFIVTIKADCAVTFVEAPR